MGIQFSTPVATQNQPILDRFRFSFLWAQVNSSFDYDFSFDSDSTSQRVEESITDPVKQIKNLVKSFLGFSLIYNNKPRRS